MRRLIILFSTLLLIFTPLHLRGQSCNPNYLNAVGNQLYDSNGNPVRLTGINWFGFETSQLVPHGLWTRDMKSMLQQIKDQGFNCLRIPWCNAILDPGASHSINSFGTDAYTGVSPMNQQEAATSSPLEVMDILVQWCQDNNLKIILDNHSRAPDGYLSEPLWYTGSVPEQEWIDDWVFLAQRYAGSDAVVGMDLNNEPHDQATWGNSNPSTDWNKAAERCGNAILAVNPNVLIIVEGIEGYNGQTTWWGGNLAGVADFPVQLSNQNKLVYSPHEYGPTVFQQTWFSDPSFPDNMPAIWQQFSNYIYDDGIAPLLCGEFGIRDQGGLDEVWIDAWLDFMGSRYSWTFWTWNPNSGDTGGILQDDWVSIQTWKMNKLIPHLFAPIPNCGGSTGSNNPPNAVASASPTSGLEPLTVSFSGNGSTDPDGDPLTFSWNFGDGGSASGVSAQHTYQEDGNYAATLTVNDGNGGLDSDQITIAVAPTPTGNEFPIPGLIQAEDFHDMSGIQTETTNDVGGGLNVGWFDVGDWLEYNVNVATSGTYDLDYRFANAQSGAIEFQINGNVLATTTIPNTGGWQNWTTVSTTVTLSAGVQTIRLFVVDAPGNINWFELSLQSGSDPPDAPSNLTANAISSSQINLVWQDNSNDETGFRVERSTGGGFSAVATLGAGTSAYSDAGLSASTTYSYRVAAFNSDGDSPFSNTASATTQTTSTNPPVAPSNLTANAVSSNAINLSWQDNSGNETGFRVERANGGGGFSAVATLNAGTTNYSDTGLAASTTYNYRVAAFNNDGDSPFSNTASATTEGAGSVVVAFANVNDWGAAFQGEITITNNGNSTINNWYLQMEMNASFNHIWNASIVSGSQPNYTLTNVGWNSNINPGGSVSFGFIASPGGAAASNFVVTSGAPKEAISSDVSNPTEFELRQNYPNPFNPTTVISYVLPKAQHVSLTVYNLVGQKILTLVSEVQQAGEHAVSFDASNLASGVYMYHWQTGNLSQIRKMVLAR